MKRAIALVVLMTFWLTGQAMAQTYQDGLRAFKRGDYRSAVGIWRPLAEQSDVQAQFRMGYSYQNGRGVPRNYGEAVRWYLRAAKGGNTNAMVNLGGMYFEGRGLPRNYTEARKWFRGAADKGHPTAQYNMGTIHAKGLGVPKSRSEAFRWYRKAAVQGNAKAQFQVGNRYLSGLGVPKNRRAALSWHFRAAHQGNSNSMLPIGLIYYTGLDGDRNYLQAYKWFSLALSRGSTQADRFRRKTAQHLTRSEILAAVRDARRWRPKSKPILKLTQRWLNQLGYTVGIVDGLQGTRTRNAVRAYQRAKGFPPDGRLTRSLLRQIAADISRKNRSGSANAQELIPRGKLPAIAWADEGKINQPGTGAGPPGRVARRRRAGRPRSTGTGFVVTKSGHILTNRHVIDKCNDVNIRWADGESGKAKILGVSKRADLALLKTSNSVGRIAKFRSGAPLRQGEDVAVYGFPLSGLLSSSGNLTAGSIAALAGLRDDAGQMQISAPIQPGNSGGPVFDRKGRIVGVVVSKLNAVKVARLVKDIPQNINFAIKGSVATNFLESRAVPYEVETGGTDRSNADNADAAKAFTVQIRCMR